MIYGGIRLFNASNNLYQVALCCVLLTFVHVAVLNCNE